MKKILISLTFVLLSVFTFSQTITVITLSPSSTSVTTVIINGTTSNTNQWAAPQPPAPSSYWVQPPGAISPNVNAVSENPYQAAQYTYQNPSVPSIPTQAYYQTGYQSSPQISKHERTMNTLAVANEFLNTFSNGIGVVDLLKKVF